MIYDVRKACREFPHTDRKFQQITDLTLKNVAICLRILLEEMKEKIAVVGNAIIYVFF
jgi:hypothetical protein